MDTDPIAAAEPVEVHWPWVAANMASFRAAAELATSGDSICAMTRCRGLSLQQLSGWRRQL